MRTKYRWVVRSFVAVMALAATAAVPAPALAQLRWSTLDGHGSVQGMGFAQPPESATFTVPSGWWTGVGLYADTYEYNLDVSGPGGGLLAQSHRVGHASEYVMVDSNAGCAKLAGSGYAAQATGLGPLDGRNPSPDNTYYGLRKTGGSVWSVDPAGQDRYRTVINTEIDQFLQVFDVYLQGGHSYRIGWKSDNTGYTGLFLLFAPDASSCVRSPSAGAAAVSMSAFGAQTYRAPTDGWYGMAIVTTFLRGTAEDFPTVMFRQA